MATISVMQEASLAANHLEAHSLVCGICGNWANYSMWLCVSCWCWADMLMTKRSQGGVDVEKVTHKFPRPWHRDSMLGYTPEWQTCEVCLRKTHCLESRLLECPGKPPPEEPVGQTATEPSAGAIEAVAKFRRDFPALGMDPKFCEVTGYELARLIDRLAVRPAIAAAEDGNDALRLEVHELTSACADLQSEKEDAEAERDRLREALGDLMQCFQDDTGEGERPFIQPDFELIAKARMALGEKGE